MDGDKKGGYPIDLECGHRLWFPKTLLRPKKKETLWCKSCQSECLQMDAVVCAGKVTWPDGWTSEPVGAGKVLGTCDRAPCEVSYTEASFRRVEQLMFQHHAIDHGKSSLIQRHDFKRPEPTSGKAPF